MQIVIKGLLTSYTAVGKGKTVLCLHGWGDSLKTFQQLAAALKDTYSVVCVDLPGFGQTQMPETPWGLNEYADFVASFTEKTGGVPYAIIGHSNGGAIAIRGLANKKLHTQKLILLSSAGIRSTYNGRKKALRVLAKAGKAATYALPKQTRERLRKKAYKVIGSDMFVAEHMQETFKKVVTDDIQQDARLLRVPALLIYGDQDDQTPSSYGEILQDSIAGSRLEIIAQAGHFAHHEQPNQVNHLVQEFLRS